MDYCAFKILGNLDGTVWTCERCCLRCKERCELRLCKERCPNNFFLIDKREYMLSKLDSGYLEELLDGRSEGEKRKWSGESSASQEGT